VKKILLGIVVLLAAFTSLWAYRWPMPDAGLRFAFGTRRQAVFLRGLEFENQEGLVQAVADGELLFYANKASLPGGFPVPTGSLVAVAHQQAIISVYTGLKLESLDSLAETIYEGDTLGRSDSRPDGNLTAFFLYDRKAGTFINPLSLLPQLNDTRPPQLRSLMLVSGSTLLPIEQARAVVQGQYRLVADAIDVLPTPVAAIPFSISLLINGVERQRFVYDSVQAVQGRLVLPSALNRQQSSLFTAAGHIDLGTYMLASGSTVISLVINDFNRNRLERSWTVTVQ